MNRRAVIATLLLGVVLASGAVWATDYSQNTTNDETSLKPAITDFEVSGPTCVEHHRQDIAIETDVNDANTTHTISQNVTVPNASTTLAVGELRSNESNYTLTLVTRDADALSRDCSAQVRYTATVWLSHGRSDAYSLVVRYDDEVLTRIEGSENGRGASAEARAESDRGTANETA